MTDISTLITLLEKQEVTAQQLTTLLRRIGIKDANTAFSSGYYTTTSATAVEIPETEVTVNVKDGDFVLLLWQLTYGISVSDDIINMNTFQNGVSEASEFYLREKTVSTSDYGILLSGHKLYKTPDIGRSTYELGWRRSTGSGTLYTRYKRVTALTLGGF